MFVYHFYFHSVRNIYFLPLNLSFYQNQMYFNRVFIFHTYKNNEEDLSEIKEFFSLR